MTSIYSQYIIAILLYGIAYIYAMVFAVYIGKCNDKICQKINRVHENCTLGCKNKTCNLTKSRGDNYFIGVTDEEKKNKLDNCLITFWGTTHFVLYFFLGIFTPNLFWETFIIGILFELYEKQYYACHDVLDIILNTSGFLIGRLLVWHYLF